MSEVPKELADEAAQRLAAFDLGLMGWDAVIAWADSWILRLDQLPELLLDVSLNPTRPADGRSALSRMADQSADPGLSPYLRTIWRELFQAGALDSVGVARAAWKARGYVDLESDDWMQILRLDHFYDDLTANWHVDDFSRARAARHLDQEVAKFLDIPR